MIEITRTGAANGHVHAMINDFTRFAGLVARVRATTQVAIVLTLAAGSATGCALEEAGDDVVNEELVSGADPARIAQKVFTTSRAILAPGRVTTSGGYVGLTVALEPTKALRAQLNEAMFGAGGKLADRGNDAHITLLTPQEYASLGDRADATITRLASSLQVEGAWQPRCVGVGVDKKNPKLQTYYVVVESTAIQSFRAQLAAEAGAFEDVNDPYHPHVTLAFTQKDLFNSNFAPGKHKDVASCPSSGHLTLLP